jgi:hypothetical protein
MLPAACHATSIDASRSVIQQHLITHNLCLQMPCCCVCAIGLFASFLQQLVFGMGCQQNNHDFIMHPPTAFARTNQMLSTVNSVAWQQQ